MQSLNYSTRELRMFRSIYRSRDFENNRNWNIKDLNEIDNNFVFTIYGNIGSISSNYRTDIRKFFQEFLKKNKNIGLQISFFPGKFSRALTVSSNFINFSPVFKSGSFKITITFSSKTNYTLINKIIYEFISNFLLFVKNEGKSISFIPFVFSLSSFSGNTNYYRIEDFNALLKNDFNKKNIIGYPYYSANSLISNINTISKKNVISYINIRNNILFSIFFSIYKKLLLRLDSING